MRTVDARASLQTNNTQRITIMGDLTNLPNFEPAPRVYTHTDLNQVFGELAVKPQAVTTGKLADNAVATAKLADKAVTTEKLQLGSVTADRLAESAVTTGKIADGAVTSAKLADDSVTEAKLADASVGFNQIKVGAVTQSRLGSNSVATSKIADGAVTEPKLADGAVTADKLAEKSVTPEKFADDVDFTPADGAITTAKLANGAITGAKIADRTIAKEKIILGTIMEGEIANGAIHTAKLANGAVTPEKLHSNKAALRNNLQLGANDTVAVKSVRLNGGGASAVTWLRTEGAVNERCMEAIYHGGHLHFIHRNANNSERQRSLNLLIDGTVQIQHGRDLQLGNGPGGQLQMNGSGWSSGGEASPRLPRTSSLLKRPTVKTTKCRAGPPDEVHRTA